MLCPALGHYRVPKDPGENLKYRRWLMARASANRRVREWVFEACATDLFFFMSSFVWQHNPKKTGRELGPFIAWDFQERGLREAMSYLFRQYPRDVLWEKSRDMGATWLSLILATWLCRFHSNKRVICVSHSEQAVDKSGSEGTLFAKIDFIVEHLPDWLAEGVERRKLNVIFPEYSSITGLASTGRSGVGDRATFVLLDEFSKQKEAYQIWGQTADTGPRLVIGTHYETAGCYYDLTRRTDMHKQVWHWLEHPEKRRGAYRFNEESNQIEVIDQGFDFDAICAHAIPKGSGCPDCEKEGFKPFQYVYDAAPRGGPNPGVRSVWYDYECARRGNERDIACNLDINPSGAMSTLFPPAMIDRLILLHAREPFWKGDPLVDKAEGVMLDMLETEHGVLDLWVHLRNKRPPAGSYVIGGDIAGGTGATPSCLSIVDASTGEKVGEYTNARIFPSDLAPVAIALCKLFEAEDGTPARFIWEQQGPGLTLAKRVIEMGFRNIYYRSSEQPHTMTVTTSDRPGWVNNSPEVLRELLVDYMVALKEGSMLNRSAAALQECKMFRFNSSGDVEHAEIASKGKPEDARKNHADHVIADALAWKVAKAMRLFSTPGVVVQKVYPRFSIGWMREQEAAGKARGELWAG